MKSSKFNFKRHQNFSKSWKMLIRFLIYSVVIGILVFLIYNPGNRDEAVINSEENQQINIEIEDVIIDGLNDENLEK